MIPHEVKNHPCAKVGLDLFEFNQRTYLVTVDYYSNFFEVDYLQCTTSKDVIHKVKAHFARYGIPDTVMSDNGPQFSSEEFRHFSKRWDFEHITSSPRHLQSNGMSESAVKTAKRLVTRALLAREDAYLSLLDLRNTPTQGMTTSPAERMLNRRTKTLLPTSQKLLEPKMNNTVTQEKGMIKDRQIKYYNATTKDLPPLSTGQAVMIEPDRKGQLWCKATVVGQSNHRPRSYEVETDTGRVLSRNRRHLRLTPFRTPGDDEYEQSPPAAEGEKEPTESTKELVSPEGQGGPYQTRSGRASKRRSYLKDLKEHLSTFVMETLWKLCYRLHCHISGYFADTRNVYGC
ncbi:uncharacterized protein [Montipora foliosa]|uniref:uncharacterized protein n=1 Tax=Montipora foliosa TaxID=591990 RepID=UPI0035F1ADBB